MKHSEQFERLRREAEENLRLFAEEYEQKMEWFRNPETMEIMCDKVLRRLATLVLQSLRKTKNLKLEEG